MVRIKISAPSLNSLSLVVQSLTASPYIGSYSSVFKGKGLEFSGFRDYSLDDDAGRIDWKTSARLNKPVVKEYTEERNIEVIFFVDVSSKMMTGSSKRLKCEYVADMVAALSHAILKTEDRVGLVLFSNKVVKFLPPQSGMNHFFSISDALSDLDNYGGKSDFEGGLKFLLENFKKKSVVFIISDFITEQKIDDELKLLGQKYDSIAMIVRDFLDSDLPPENANVLVQDPTTGEKTVISPKEIRKYYSFESKKELRTFKNLLNKSSVSSIELSTDSYFVDKIMEFFKRRELKWR